MTNAMSVYGLSVDCDDAAAVASFWSQALGRPVNSGATEQDAAIDATDPAQGPRLAFHQVPESKTVKNRLHLDLIAPEYDAERERLVGLGATVVNEVSAGSARWTTFTDVEGNEFDVIAGWSRPGRRATVDDTNTYVPSPNEWVREQVARYEATGGADGGELNGRPVIIITTTGAVTGAVRKNPIMKVTDGADYVAVASYAGGPKDPAWYRNLVAHPDAVVQDGPTVIAVHAHEVHGAEKQRLWDVADAVSPVYADYRSKAGRDIPVLRLSPTAAD
jgi:F420H(2)-dependent quinone reductase